MLILSSVVGNPSDLLGLLQSADNSQFRANGSSATASSDQANAFLGQVPSVGSQSTVTSAPAASGIPPFSPNVLAFLILNQGQPSTPPQGPDASPMTPWQSRLFAKLDNNGDGTISKSELEAALGADGNTTAADATFSKLDANGDGAIDPSEMAAARPHRHHHHMRITDAGSQDNSSNATPGADNASGGPLASLLDTGGTSSTATNPDGSTTTTISYPDGSTITMTAPAQGGPNTTSVAGTPQSGTSASNTLETLIRLQAQLLATPTITTSGVTPATA
jgi:hypothetical protein